MFQSACRIYKDCICLVGGARNEASFFRASGCFVSRIHVVTALHNVTEAQKEFDSPIVSRGDGVFRYEVLYSSDELDLALIEVTDKVSSDTGIIPTDYPDLGPGEFSFGMTLGYMGWRIRGPHNNAKVFSMGTTSVVVGNQVEPERWTVIGGLAESGFSGSPVFNTGGELLGIVVTAAFLDIQMDGRSEMAEVAVQISPLPDLAPELRASIKAHCGL